MIPRGPIPRATVRLLLRDFLGIASDPDDDEFIRFWEGLRWQEKQLRREVKFTLPRNGRGSPGGNGPRQRFLLGAFPRLARASLNFVMLESLFGLDQFEALRFPPPAARHRSPEGAAQQRSSVRDLARRRFTRARAMLARTGFGRHSQTRKKHARI